MSSHSRSRNKSQPNGCIALALAFLNPAVFFAYLLHNDLKQSQRKRKTLTEEIYGIDPAKHPVNTNSNHMEQSK